MVISIVMMRVDRKTRYQQMQLMLNEKQWRQFLALEAKERGSVLEVALDAGVSKNTVRRGLTEIEGGAWYQPGTRQRKEGAGRKTKESQDETFIADLEGLLDPKGDPMSFVRWTTKSMAHLKRALQDLGHQVGESTIRRVLQTLGLTMAHLCGESKLEREGSTKEKKGHAERTENVHQGM
jgi:transposase